jgi:hypothetical protein
MAKRLSVKQRVRIIADTLARSHMGYIRTDADGVKRNMPDDAAFLAELADRFAFRRLLRRQRARSNG